MGLPVPTLDLVLALALLLLVVGMVGSVVPVVPGGPLSLAGVYLYWWSTGFGSPGLAFVVIATLLGLAAVAVDVFGGAFAASAAGTDGRTAALAGLVGLVLVFVAGPLGIFAGVAATVYVAERYRGTAHRESLGAAWGTLVGMLLANGVQFLLTTAIFLGFVWVVLL